MHIPDGYLSPSTCAVLWAAAMPFWSAAMRRVREIFSSKFIPLVSLSAAFSFVIMMFNIPLPGGTTGHAAGVAIAAITLGPWGAILAISVALAIQALFFGDGGILALGANCFNIAIAGSLVASAVYRIGSGSSPLEARRRMFAAGLAGYLAINAAALLTAFQLGIQPALFRDAAGMPLYAPYPLWIAIPAMMIGHVTIAGLAEGAITAGIVGYLQRAKPSLLNMAAAERAERASGWRALRPLWIGIAVLLILTPLGLVATGTAWGEWRVEDFEDPAGRESIAAASRDVVVPGETAPEGLRRWAALWNAPIPDYAPEFLRNESAGYVLSGMLGVGLIIAFGLLIDGWSRSVRRGLPLTLF